MTKDDWAQGSGPWWHKIVGNLVATVFDDGRWKVTDHGKIKMSGKDVSADEAKKTAERFLAPPKMMVIVISAHDADDDCLLVVEESKANDLYNDLDELRKQYGDKTVSINLYSADTIEQARDFIEK